MAPVWREQISGRIDDIPSLAIRLTGAATKHFLTVYTALLTLAGTIPHRADLKPEMIHHFLPQMVLFEVPREGSPIYRLVGQQVREEFATNPIGRRYADFVHPARLDSALASFRHCCFGPCGMLVHVDHVRRSGKAEGHEVLGLPLRTDTPDTGLLLFADSIVDAVLGIPGDEDDTDHHRVRERLFINLGHGLPPEHVDLILAGD